MAIHDSIPREGYGPALGRWAAAVLFVIGLIVSGVVASAYASRNSQRLTQALAVQSAEQIDEVSARMKGFERTVRGTRGVVLVAGPESIDASTYAVYAESRDPALELPGAHGYGYIRRRGERAVVRFVSPLSGNSVLVGRDIAADPEQRAAALRSIVSGTAAMTAPLPALRGSALPTAWALLLLPVEKDLPPFATAEERDAATVGWAFVVIDLTDLLRGIALPDDVDLRIVDVTDAAHPLPVASIGRLRSATPGVVAAPAVAELFGRQWAFTVRGGTQFVSAQTVDAPLRLFGAGALASALTALLLAGCLSYARNRRAFRLQQRLLSNFVADASDAIITESLDGRVLSWNAASEQLFGYGAADTLGRRLDELIMPPDRLHEDGEIIERCAAGKRVKPFDTVRRRRDGVALDVSVAAIPITDTHGRIIALAKTLRDISERKAAESTLQRGVENLEREVDRRSRKVLELQRDLHTITDALPSMIGYWDKNLANRFANRAYCEWLGVDPERITGLHLPDLLGEHFAVARPNIELALRGETVTFERDLRSKTGGGPSVVMIHYVPDSADGEVHGFYVMIHDITSLKATQRQLAESEKFLEQAGAISGVGGFRIDLRSGRQTWTRHTFEIYDVDGEEAPSTEELDKLMAPEVAARLWEAIRGAAETGAGYDIEVPLRTRRGRAIWTRTIGVVENENGRPARVVGAIQDITAQKLAEEALRITGDRLALAAEAAELGVWEFDAQTEELYWDDQMYRFYERDRATSAVDRARAASLVHPEDRDRVEREFTAALRGTAKFDTEYRIVLRSGQIRNLKASAKVQRDTAGTPLRMVGVNIDITHRKAAELLLIESEFKFRSLFELSPVGIALNDLETGRFLHLNEAMAAPSGYSPQELLSMSYWDLLPGRYTASESAALQALDDTDRYGPYEKEYLRKDGSTYPVLLSGIRVRDAAGRAVIWSIVQDISERKAMESQLALAAKCDKLTGLANRALFMERLDKAVERVKARRQQLFAVLFLDFDRFKLINDTLGHEKGDELLRQIARRLRGELRASDALNADDTGNVVGRFGGDEFLVLINDLKSPDAAARIAERLLNALAPTYDLEGTEVHSSASIGIITSDQCCTAAEDVVRNADVAMYEAKRAGRACSVVFNEGMHTRLTRHVTIENHLRHAIGSRELYLVYQPIVDLSSGAMVSAEALIRWNHPTLGVIAPSEFIPIAEESNLIVALGEWVQQEACEAMVYWRERWPDLAPSTISVNVSRAELSLGRRFIDQIRRTLERVGLPPQCLQLEVTEREVMRHPEAAQAVLHELQSLGMKLAMDDFGTGTSSLAFLRNYPFNTIKIDRSFMQDVTGSGDVLAVIHATVTLVENLGMNSLAEGVEDAAQLALLQSLGCRFGQGYFFSPGVSREALVHALDDAASKRFAVPASLDAG